MHDLQQQLRDHASAFGPALARDTAERGLAVTLKEGGTRPIPVTATAVVVEQAEIARRAEASALLSSATAKMARALLAGSRRQVLLGALSPLERKVAEATYARAGTLATVRLDFFVGPPDTTHPQGRPMALEVNATIPAMQAYSDIAANGLIEHVGRYARLSPERISALTRANGSNTEALYQALLQGYAQARGGRRPERILLLCRRNDAQITEQRHLAKRFSELGTEAIVAHPDELSGEGEVRCRGKKWDLVYRHLFVRRLEEIEAPWVARFFERFFDYDVVLLNPPASQVEVKTTFAYLSIALDDPRIADEAGLTGDELSAISERVPWTRPFVAGPTLLPDGERAADLIAEVAAHPERFVLKRAWDYGGRAVFVGKSVGSSSFEERVVAAYGERLDWSTLCARAAADKAGGGFVVQRYVATSPERHTLCTETGVSEAELYVDFSAYASVGIEGALPWGGVCRGSVSQIVNIQGGGGVIPLLHRDVADALLAGLRALPAR